MLRAQAAPNPFTDCLMMDFIRTVNYVLCHLINEPGMAALTCQTWYVARNLRLPIPEGVVLPFDFDGPAATQGTYVFLNIPIFWW